MTLLPLSTSACGASCPKMIHDAGPHKLAPHSSFASRFVTEDFGYLLIQSLLMLLIGLVDPEQDVLRRGFFDAWDQRTVALLLVLLPVGPAHTGPYTPCPRHIHLQCAADVAANMARKPPALSPCSTHTTPSSPRTHLSFMIMTTYAGLAQNF